MNNKFFTRRFVSARCKAILAYHNGLHKVAYAQKANANVVRNAEMRIGMEQELLKLAQVSGKKNKGFVLSNISFSLPAGYIMGIAGKNGAGKTTLIDYIIHPVKQYTGSMTLLGEEIHDNPVKMRDKIGFVSDNNHFFLERSAKQNAQITGVLYDNWDMDLFFQAMDRMELSPSKVVGKMSRGEQMRFQMAYAMAHRPVLYLLDEVTAGMDPVFRIDFFRVLQQVIAEEQASVLMTSHIEEELGRKMDYIGVLENGKLISFEEQAG